jgi:hypothetical protein
MRVRAASPERPSTARPRGGEEGLEIVERGLAALGDERGVGGDDAVITAPTGGRRGRAVPEQGAVGDQHEGAALGRGRALRVDAEAAGRRW